VELVAESTRLALIKKSPTRRGHNGPGLLLRGINRPHLSAEPCRDQVGYDRRRRTFRQRIFVVSVRIRHASLEEPVVDADAADTDVVLAGREGHIACAGSCQVAIRKRHVGGVGTGEVIEQVFASHGPALVELPFIAAADDKPRNRVLLNLEVAVSPKILTT
jgi:hypothetical protein